MAYILGSDWTKSVHGNLMSAITTPCQRRGVFPSGYEYKKRRKCKDLLGTPQVARMKRCTFRVSGGQILSLRQRHKEAHT